MPKQETILDRKYNPENDLTTNEHGYVYVTWADYDLQQQIHRLREYVTMLEARITELQASK